MKPFYWIIKTFFKFFFKLFYHHKVYGTSLIPPGAAIIAPNHCSFFDPPIISGSLTEEGYFLARSSLFNNTFLKLIIENLNAYPVAGSAQDLNSFKIVSKLLKEKKKVVVFPEGIRSYDGTLGEIKTGVAMLALRADCPIIPVYIHGAFDVWPRQQRYFNFRGKTACVFGHPLYPTFDSSLTKKQQQEFLTQQLKESLIALKNWYIEGAKGDPPK